MSLTIKSAELVAMLDAFRKKKNAEKYASNLDEIEKERKKLSFWQAFKNKSAKKHFSDACYVIGIIVGVLGALTFGFLYTTVLFTNGWPIVASISVLICTAIPSIIVEVLVLGVLKDNVGDVFRAFGESIWDLFTLKPKNNIKYKPLTWKDIFHKVALSISIVLNGAGMAFLSWVSLMLFLTSMSVSGMALFIVPTVFAFFLFGSSISFNFFLNRSSFQRKQEEEKANTTQQTFEPEAISEKAAKHIAKIRKLKAWTFGIFAGVIVCLVTLISMYSLPFALPIIIGCAAGIAVPHLLTQISSAQSGAKQFLDGDDWQSTKINTFLDYERLKAEKQNSPNKKLGIFNEIRFAIIQKFPNAFTKFMFGGKWGMLILKGVSTAIFTAMTLITLGTLLGFAPPVGAILIAVIAAAVLSALPDLINTALQNRAVFFNESDDSKAVRSEMYEAVIDNHPDKKPETQKYFQATYSHKTRTPSGFEKAVNAFFVSGPSTTAAQLKL